jgi:hypothetical protein
MRLLLDTHILLSALLSSLGAAKLLDAWERNAFTLVACDALIAELRDVAGRPFFRARLRASAAELLAAGLGASLFLAEACPPAPSRQTPRTVTCSRWLKPAGPSSSCPATRNSFP